MALSDDDKQIVHAMFVEGSAELGRQLNGKLDRLVEQHELSCSHGRKLSRYKSWVLGLAAGACLFGGGGVGIMISELIKGYR